MKKSLSLLISFCGACLLVGCGGGRASNAPNSSPPAAPLAITSGAPPAATLQSAYAGSSGFSLTASGGESPYAWSWTAASGSALPPGLSISTNADGTGTIAGTPSTAGTYSLVVKITDSASPHAQATANYTIAVTPAGALTIISGVPPSGTVGETYGGTHSLTVEQATFSYSGWPLTATGGVSGYSWSWSAAQGSSLPPGLNVEVLTLTSGGSTRCCVTAHVLVIGGTPTGAGTYNVVVTVTDSASRASQAKANYAIVIAPSPSPTISTTPAPSAGAVNLPYNFAFTVASGGQPPFSWSETGMLPAGLVFNNEGVLSGTPTALGSSPITVMVQDAVGQNSAPQNFTIQIYQYGFKTTGSMEAQREYHRATLLDFGLALTNGKVLVTGGLDSNNQALASAELFDPISGTFTAAKGSMETPRAHHTSTLLNDGMVLVTGGVDASGTPLASAELFNPATGMFTPTKGNMETARIYQTATLLNDGTVLVTGGVDASGTPLASAELFNPASGMFTLTNGSLETPRFDHTATLLNDGTVLVIGGSKPNRTQYATAELFDPKSKTFTPTMGSMATARAFHTATLLNDRTVLVTGGLVTVGNGVYANLATAELFDPHGGMFTPTKGSMDFAKGNHTATLLSDGTVLVTGGLDGSTDLAMAELFDPANETFTRTADMVTPRAGHTATLLQNGRVLVTGGAGADSSPVATAELYQ